MKILFISANRLGDAVMSMGLLSWMVDNYPNAQFTIACGPFAAGLFRAVPRLERLIILHKKPYKGHWIDLWTCCIGTSWDLIVDVRNSLVPHLLRSKRVASKKKDTGRHKIVDMGAILNLDPPPSPKIWLSEESEAKASQLLPPNRELLAMGPLANWAPKEWPLDRFAAFAKKMTSSSGPMPNALIVIIADETERPRLQPLLDAIAPEKRIDLLGYDLLTVAACLKRCRFFIGNDSGLMHLAYAVGIPTLGLFGPGNEKVYAPWGTATRFIRTPESIEELWKRIPYRGAHHPNLMGGLPLDRVYEVAQELFE